MQDMTMREAGREGVLLAIRDGMMAGKMSKDIDELLKEIEEKDEKIKSLETTNQVLTKEIDGQKYLIETMRRTIRDYRKQHMECYQKLIDRQMAEKLEPWARAQRALSWISVGVILTTLLTSLILWIVK